MVTHYGFNSPVPDARDEERLFVSAGHTVLKVPRVSHH